MPTFIDVHVLQTVPPSNINRDDTGSPKSAIYGGVRRARVSSQAWKRAARSEFNGHLEMSECGERTVLAAGRVAAAITASRPDLSDSAENLAITVLQAAGLKLKEIKPKKGSDSAKPHHETGYLLFLSRAQIQALAELAIASEEGSGPDKKAAKKALTDANSVDIALFGRMVAEAPDLNVDACCQVAHALSVHSAVTEFDYFTAVDDNAPADNAGAEMIATIEFTSSTLYRYATINAKELVASLGSAQAAAKAVEAFVRAFAVSMPTGKQNTFANRTRPELVLVSVRDDQPVNFVEAFEDAITEVEGRVKAATVRLADYAVEQDSAFASTPVSGAYLAVGGAAASDALSALDRFATRTDLNGVCELAGQAVRDDTES